MDEVNSENQENTSAEVKKEFLNESDKLILALSKSQHLTAIAEARAAIANSEKNEVAYKYVVLQLYMKYGLNVADALREDGEIVRGGAVNQSAQG